MLMWKRKTHRKGREHEEVDSFSGGGRARDARDCFWLHEQGG